VVGTAQQSGGKKWAKKRAVFLLICEVSAATALSAFLAKLAIARRLAIVFWLWCEEMCHPNDFFRYGMHASCGRRQLKILKKEAGTMRAEVKDTSSN
jgi:hypothetical protein